MRNNAASGHNRDFHYSAGSRRSINPTAVPYNGCSPMISPACLQCPSRLRKNSLGRWNCAGRHIRENRSTARRMLKRPSSKAAASEEARRTLRYVEPLREARTLLTDFFSILLERARGTLLRVSTSSMAGLLLIPRRSSNFARGSSRIFTSGILGSTGTLSETTLSDYTVLHVGPFERNIHAYP